MHLGRRTATAVLLLIAGLLTPLTSVGPASAAEPAWQAPHHLSQPVRMLERSISCPRATWCMAVDSLGHGQQFNGRRWRVPAAASHHYGFLNDVSCPTSQFCMAVGPYAYVVHRPAGWSRPRPLPVVGGAVSCSSATFCLVVDTTGHSARWNGHRWGDLKVVAAHHNLEQVSCAGPRMCLASGDTGRSYRYDGHRWRSAGNPFSILKRPQDGVALSCVSTRWCLGSSVSYVGQHWWAVYDGRHWQRAHRLVGKGLTTAASCASRHFCVVASGHQLTAWHGSGTGHAHAFGPDFYPQSVGCGGAGRCVASGYGDGLYEAVNDFSYTLRGGAWHRLNDTEATDPDGGVGASCPSDTWCMVATGSRRTWVHAGGTWSQQLLPDNPPPADGNPPPAHVSCTSPDFCVLLQHGAFHTWDGTSWSDGTVVPGATWQDVSCASPSMCLAVGEDSESYDGVTTRWNGESWDATTPVPIGAPDVLTVSCATADHCVAGDLEGEALTVDHGTWSRVDAVPVEDETERLSSMSCPTTTFCMVESLTSGVVAVLHDRAWHLVSDAPVGSLSCPTEGHCTVAQRRETQMESWDYSLDEGFAHQQRIDPPGYGRRQPVVACAGPTYCLAVDGEVNAFERR
jgi:hypothetical protein